MGDLLIIAPDGRHQEAIEMLQKAYGILETCDDPEGPSWSLCKLGEAFRAIGAWDDSITALEKSVTISASIEFEVKGNELQRESNHLIGQIYLEQYHSDTSLVGAPERREEVTLLSGSHLQLSA